MTVRCVVPVSGGKDSQACLKLALHNFKPWEVRGLFCDTGFEHPLTYQHVRNIGRMYGVQIDTVQNGTVEQQCLKHGRFPSDQARFCTEELKIWPTKRYIAALAHKQGSAVQNKRKKIEGSKAGGFEVWYGMRGDESREREQRYAGKVCDEVYAPHDVLRKYPKYLEKLGIMFRLSVVDWSTADVVDYVGADNLNPLYAQGFPRVGCFPCLASGPKWKRKAFQHDAFGTQQFQRVMMIAKHIDKDPFTGKPLSDNDNDAQGCLFCAI